MKKIEKIQKIDFFTVFLPFLISGAVFFEFSEKNCTYLCRRFEKNRILIKKSKTIFENRYFDHKRTLEGLKNRFDRLEL